MDFSNDKLITIPRPELGRPVDPRVTPEYIAARPALERAGYPAFDPEQDIDVHGYIEAALQWLHAQIQYANPELGGRLTALKGELEKTLADTAQNLTLLQNAVDTKTVKDEAALAGQPEGAYIVIATGERVWWDGQAITARAPADAVLSGTRAQRKATNPTGTVVWRESDTGLLLSFFPGVGWRGATGANVDNPPPPPPADTGVY